MSWATVKYEIILLNLSWTFLLVEPLPFRILHSSSSTRSWLSLGGGIVKVTFHCSGGQVELVWPHWNMAAGSLAGSLPHSVIHSLGQPGGLTNQPHALEKKKKYADYLMSWTLETLEIRNFKSLTAKDLLRKWVNFSQFLSPKWMS